MPPAGDRPYDENEATRWDAIERLRDAEEFLVITYDGETGGWNPQGVWSSLTVLLGVIERFKFDAQVMTSMEEIEESDEP